MNPCLRGNSGSALPTVLAFAAIGLIVVVAYLAHQSRMSTAALRAPAALQATLNARSGVYRALKNLLSDDRGGFDTLSTISAVDNLFRTDMFDDVETGTATDTGFYYEPIDANVGVQTRLYANDSINTADVAISNYGMYSLITSTSTVLDITRKVEARLGSFVPAGLDTVLIIDNTLPINGNFTGKARQIDKSIDSLSITHTQSSKTEEGKIANFISGINKQVIPDDDTTSFGIPVIVRSYDGIAALSDTVNTHLMLDGSTSSSNIVWKEKRKIAVFGDLQVTGSFGVENVEFSVSGEVRILDKASLKDVYIFSMQRIFIGDNAVFSGDALAMGAITIYGSAEVIGKSSLISTSSPNFMPKGNIASSRYSVLISESATFDGVAVALGDLGGIKTDPGVKITGILWAQKAVCHGGMMSGIIRAEYLVDCTDASKKPPSSISEVKENTFLGMIAPLQSIESYNMPYFLGIPHIVGWREY